MQMQMGHCLLTVFTAVKNSSVSRTQTFIGGDLFCYQEQMTNQRFIIGNEVVKARDRFLGNDQNMGWRLRTDVAERQAAVIFVNDRCRNFAIGNLFKQRFLWHSRSGVGTCCVSKRSKVSGMNNRRPLDQKY